MYYYAIETIVILDYKDVMRAFDSDLDAAKKELLTMLEKEVNYCGDGKVAYSKIFTYDYYVSDDIFRFTVAIFVAFDDRYIFWESLFENMISNMGTVTECPVYENDSWRDKIIKGKTQFEIDDYFVNRVLEQFNII